MASPQKSGLEPPTSTAATPSTRATSEALSQDGEVGEIGEVEVKDSIIFAGKSLTAIHDDDSDAYSTCMVSQELLDGIIENGRRYRTFRKEHPYWGPYWSPSDDQQCLSMELGYLIYLLMDCRQQKLLFRSPLSSSSPQILDLGTGTGGWAVDVADPYLGQAVYMDGVSIPVSDARVIGVDLYPPDDETWVPPNLSLMVDNVLKLWYYTQKLDFIRISPLMYQQAYNNLQPGGWIEQVEPGFNFDSDDNSISPDSKMADWRDMLCRLGVKRGKPMDTYGTMGEPIAAKGYINIHEQFYKIPIRGWSRNKRMKAVGKVALEQFETGMEEYVMKLLTEHGEPEPWTAENVREYLAELKEELRDKMRHAYTIAVRIWAQKPRMAN